MIPVGIVGDDERGIFHAAVRACVNPELVLTSVDTLFEFALAGPNPVYVIGIRIPSPELGKTIMASSLIPIGSDRASYDQAAALIAQQLVHMRNETMERLAGRGPE